MTGIIAKKISRHTGSSGYPKSREIWNVIRKSIGFSKNRGGLYCVSGESRFRRIYTEYVS